MSQENVSSEMCDQVKLKPVCSATEEFGNCRFTKYRHYTIQAGNNKGADQTADVQGDLRLCCSHMAKDRFSHDVAHLSCPPGMM